MGSKFLPKEEPLPREYGKTNLGDPISEDAMKIFDVYLEIFDRKWGLHPKISEYAGQIVGEIFEAEFAEYGHAAYCTSINLAIRNATYQAYMVEWRWKYLREMGIMSPVLNYGCGVGFFELWLHGKGYKDLYGYELPGAQKSVMVEAFEPRGINVWDHDRDGFNTILCINVLEHIPHPMELLDKLYGLGKRVIADISIDADDKIQGPHVAPHAELEECEKVLMKRKGLYINEGGPRGLDGQRIKKK